MNETRPSPSSAQARPAAEAGSTPGLLAGELRAGLTISAATGAAVLGAFFLARGGGVSLRNATLTALAVAATWIALAAPVLAAGARSGLRAFLRAGLTADAALAAMLVIWLIGAFSGAPQSRLTIVSVLEAYCTYLAMAMAGAAAVGCARLAWKRLSLALAAAVLVIAAMATPFWVGGILRATEGPARENAVALAVYCNPLYSISSAVIEPMQYVIHQATVMYQCPVTLIGDIAAPPPCPWYAAACIYTALAGILVAIRMVLPAGKRRG